MNRETVTKKPDPDKLFSYEAVQLEETIMELDNFVITCGDFTAEGIDAKLTKPKKEKMN